MVVAEGGVTQNEIMVDHVDEVAEFDDSSGGADVRVSVGGGVLLAVVAAEDDGSGDLVVLFV